MHQKLAQPGFWMAALMALMILAIQVGLSMPLGILDVVFEQALHRPPPRLAQQPLVIAYINLIAFGCVLTFGLFLNRLPLRKAFPIRGIPATQCLGIAMTVLGTGVLLSELDNAFRWLAPPPPWLHRLLREMMLQEGNLISRVFLLVVVAPITEELLFRGLILRGLLSRYRPAIAIALSSLLFGAVHVNPWQFFSASFLGVALGWFYLRTGSISACVLGHAIANGLFVLFTSSQIDIPGLTGMPDFSFVQFQPWWLDSSGALLLLAGIWIFRRASALPAGEDEPQPPPVITPIIPGT